MPGSGGSYVYLREGYGRETWGRLAAFLFIWQFILSGPLEIASGYIGFSQYLGYLWPSLTPSQYRLDRRGRRPPQPRAAVSADRIARSAHGHALGRQPADHRGGDRHRRAPLRSRGSRSIFRPGAFNFSLGFLIGLGAASRVGIYDYLGYYDICYIGDEVKDPGRVIPRSILISIVVRRHHLSRDQPLDHRRRALARVRARRRSPELEVHRLRLHGEDLRPTRRHALHRGDPVDGVRVGLRAAARLLADSVRRRAMTATSSRRSAACTRRRAFPYISLLVVGAVSIVCSFFSLGLVIDALITTRILVQFIGQIGALDAAAATRRWRARVHIGCGSIPYRVWSRWPDGFSCSPPRT